MIEKYSGNYSSTTFIKNRCDVRSGSKFPTYSRPRFKDTLLKETPRYKDTFFSQNMVPRRCTIIWEG